MERPRRFHTKHAFKMLNICARIGSWDLQDVKERRYWIILTSPEMCLGDSGFVALLKAPQWSCSILFMVVDKAHCIKRWGSEFRKHYTSLETLCPFVPRGAPVLATSATMPPMTLENGGVMLVCSAWILCGVIGVFVPSTAFFKNSLFIFGCW